MKAGDVLVPALVGAAAGGAVGLAMYALIRVAIDRQITATIDREVPPRLRQELDAKLASYGLTPAVGANIARFVGSLDQAGLFTAIGSFNPGVARA